MFRELTQRRLIFVSGKGGVGKTTVVTALGLYLAGLGRKVLLAEVDNARPTIGGYFDRPIKFSPVRVGMNLDAVNIDFMSALRAFLHDVVPVERLVRLILRNRIVRTFLVATPGAREMVVLGRLLQLARDSGVGHDIEGWDGDGGAEPVRRSVVEKGWDHMIIDMPASGHAASMFGTPLTVRKLFKVGPIRRAAEEILQTFQDKNSVALVMVSISEEMSINETIETMARVRAFGWPPLAGVVLNRYPRVAFQPRDEALLKLVEELEEGPGNISPVLESAKALLNEQARSNQALERLVAEADGMVTHLPFVKGGSVEVARQLAEIMREQTPTFHSGDDT
jgi:arsenite/tail-anchored protein-transporting ATPase